MSKKPIPKGVIPKPVQPIHPSEIYAEMEKIKRRTLNDSHIIKIVNGILLNIHMFPTYFTLDDVQYAIPKQINHQPAITPKPYNIPEIIVKHFSKYYEIEAVLNPYGPSRSHYHQDLTYFVFYTKVC